MSVAYLACCAAAVFHFKVNNQKVAIPYNPNDHLRVLLRAQRLFLITDFEMVVDYDGKHSAGNWGTDTDRRAPISEPGMLAHTRNPNPWEPEAGGSPVSLGTMWYTS